MISYSTQPGSPVVEIKVEGMLTNQELEDTITRLQAGFDQDGKSRILEIIEHFTGMSPPLSGPTCGWVFPSPRRLPTSPSSPIRGGSGSWRNSATSSPRRS
jgi:hypothetical protein